MLRREKFAAVEEFRKWSILAFVIFVNFPLVSSQSSSSAPQTGESAYAVGESSSEVFIFRPTETLKHVTEYQILWSHQQRNIRVCAPLVHLHAERQPGHLPPFPSVLRGGYWRTVRSKCIKYPGDHHQGRGTAVASEQPFGGQSCVLISHISQWDCDTHLKCIENQFLHVHQLETCLLLFPHGIFP